MQILILLFCGQSRGSLSTACSLSVKAEYPRVRVLPACDLVFLQDSCDLAEDDAIAAKAKREIKILALGKAPDIWQAILCPGEKTCPMEVCFPPDMRK